MKTKRIRQWVNEFSQGKGAPTYCSTYNRRKSALATAGSSCLRVAVPLVELRRGEAVVDVKALEEAFAEEIQDARHVWEVQIALRAAIKRVGVR